MQKLVALEGSKRARYRHQIDAKGADGGSRVPGSGPVNAMSKRKPKERWALGRQLHIPVAKQKKNQTYFVQIAVSLCAGRMWGQAQLVL